MLSDLRKHPRYFLPSGLPAVIEQNTANIVDLSVKGARVQITKQLAAGEKISFALRASGDTIAGTGTVLWCQIAALALDDEESDVYLAGLVFDDEMASISGVLDQLIAADQAIAIVDSRSTERYSITHPIHGTYSDATDVRLIDLSIRGARITSSVQIRVGTTASLRFRLNPGPAVDVRGTVMWCRPADRGTRFEFGLNITGEEALLRAVIAQLCMKKQARVDMNSLRRKFDPLNSQHKSGVLALAS